MSLLIRTAVHMLLLLVLSAIFMPSLNWQSTWFILLFAICAIAASTVLIGPKDRTPVRFYDQPKVSNSAVMRMASTAAVSVTAIAFLILFSVPMTRSESYSDLLGAEQTGNFTAGLPPLDIQKAPLVSRAMALRAAEKRLAEIPALGSQVEIGDLEKQLVRGELYWVAFLEHRGFFKWSSAETTPGYVMVSAHDPADVKLVTEVGGKKLALRYLTSAFFGDDAERRTYWNGFAHDMRGAYVPEIDETGRPFLVAPIYEKKIVLGGVNVAGAVVLDVQSGDLQRYSLEALPAWIDRIQSEDVVAQQLEHRLHLVNGWLNPSDKGRLELSGDLDLVYGTDGRAYYFAGHTSVANRSGMVSFSLIDSRTKATTRYALSGITEITAQHLAQGVYPEKRYQATNALPFILEGRPVLVMAMTDGTGVPRGYGIVSMEPSQTVAVADTLAATARLFLSKVITDRTRLDSSVQPEGLIELTTKVLRKGAEMRGGNTSYTLVLEGQPGVLFAAGPDLSEDLPVTSEGDIVEVEFAKGSSKVIGLLGLRNVTLSAKPEHEPAPQPTPQPAQ